LVSLSRKILGHRKLVIVLFVAAALLSTVLQFGVFVNYNIVDYLPEDAESTKALEIMREEFDSGIPNARVLIPDVSITEALEYKKALSEIDGVSDLMWLDDVIDLHEPLEMADKAIVENYYKDGSALISLAIRDSDDLRIIKEIRSLIGEEGAISGNAIVSATSKEMSAGETTRVMIFLVPLIIIILIITTTSWIEPLLFMLAIGVAILLNMGTNLLFDDISFITFSVSPILQMAVSLDYAIFLLSSFRKYRETTSDISEAMSLAMKRSLPAVLASALTTLFGFLALVFMRFEIGANLGLNLAKGVVFSLVSVMVFLPCITVSCYRLIDKTKHRRFIPTFKGSGRVITKVRIPALILVILLALPSYLAQNKTSFIYGIGDLEPSTRAGMDEMKVNDIFGQSVPTVLLVPRGDVAKEAELTDELAELNNVTSVVSYTSSVGAEIPPDYLDKEIVSQFYSDNYSRIIVYGDTNEEGEEAFALVKEIRDTARKYYGSEALTFGASANLYDVKDIVTSDSFIVNLLAVLAIGFVLLLTFKSLSLPFILIITIQSSIWINLSIPYFLGSALSYIGYLVISTVQLGATVDYAILFTDHYLVNRRELLPKEAVIKTAEQTVSSVLTSAAILSLSGFILSFISTNDIVSQLGTLLGRGAILSTIMVLFFLPAATTLLDSLVYKTTLRADFYKKEHRHE
jgi:predicted RND superfamily exporter protein